jgi:DNA-binding response OmpR family regulator
VTPPLLVVMLLTAGEEADRVLALDPGVDAHVVNPFSRKRCVTFVRGVKQGREKLCAGDLVW